ncbi:MAG: response regulator [Pseudomonadales bacterium]|nr:response regulator [Pseudomonadales bacterium]MCP5346107.1 response regulator [Pseudomonadales bacterium]
MPAIKVLLADDHLLLTEGITRLLADEPDLEVIGCAGTGEEALELFESLAPDVVLMDVKMPGIGGIEATQRIVERYPLARVVGMSSIDVGVIPSRMLAAGARAFITKSGGVEELLLAIRKVHAGQHYVSPSVATKLGSDPFARRRKGGIRRKILFDRLSKRELQIAMALSDGAKVSAIADLLNISPKTVYTYRYRIFEKLGIKSDVELTILAMKNGVTETSEDYIEYGQQRQIG